MDYQKYLFCVLALISVNDAVKVNMQGSLTLGKEVMDTISHYMQRNIAAVSGRRSLGPGNPGIDVISLIIQSSYLCRDLYFCDDDLEKFLNEYILVQTKSIESILEGFIHQNEIDNGGTETRFLFESELKMCLHAIRKLLRSINLKLKYNNHVPAWIEVIKRISVMFRSRAIEFATERIESTPTTSKEVRKILTQKFVVASVLVEGRYENKLCVEYKICVKNYKCTKALHTLLESFKDMEDDKMKIFLRSVSETVMETKFYDQLSEVTANEFQIILNDMAYSDNVPTREVLLSILQTVGDRLTSLETKTHRIKGRDAELVHSILSDLDHAYSKVDIVDPFHTFLSSFFKWLRTGGRLAPNMRTLLKDIKEQVNALSGDLILKLTKEVRVFLELTVDPVN